MERAVIAYRRSRFIRTGVRRPASSLIELLVVFSIIGTLITMLLPSLKRSMELASATVCMHNLREIYHSLELYRVENDGWFPTNRVVAPPAPTGVRYRSRASRDKGGAKSRMPNNVWFLKLFPTYMNDPLALTCPKDPYRFRMVGLRDMLKDPSVSDYSSYGINSFLMNAKGGQLANIDRFIPSRPLDTMLVADLGPDRGLGEGGKRATYGPMRNEGRLSWNDGYDPLETERTPSPWLTQRHNNGINVLTIGGAVRRARTANLAAQPMQRWYRDCAGGSCSLCAADIGDQLFHYSFAKDRLYWWTGRIAID